LPTKYWHGSHGPYIGLLMRWWLAKVFFLRGLTGVMIVQGALEVARYEYPRHVISSVGAVEVWCMWVSGSG
jgi:hypothetical protein